MSAAPTELPKPTPDEPANCSQFSKLAWIEAVICSPLPDAQRLVIVYIGMSANKHGFGAWRANGRVSEMLGLVPKTVTRARAAAVEAGLMVVTRPAPKGAGNTRTTEYRLTMPSTNRDSGVPIYSDEIGTLESTNRDSGVPEIGTPESIPLGNPLGFSLGERGTAPFDEPIDVTTVPDSNAPPSLIIDSIEEEQPDVIVGEILDSDPDPEPALECLLHRSWPIEMPRGRCHDCKRVREANEAAHGEWKSRRAIKTLIATQAEPDCDACGNTGWRLDHGGRDGDTPKKCNCGRRLAS